MRALKIWWVKTHGPMFELVRHFISRFFDSELVTSSGEWRPVLIGAFAMLVPAISLIAPGLVSKYKYLSKLGDASQFNLAVRADSLWIITLMMSVVGLLTAILLSSLFPDPHDYLILGSLPVRLWRIFAAKLTALLLVATICIVAINSFVSVPLAFFTGGTLRFNRSAAAHCIGQSAASIGASYFVFFAIIASQGLIMSLPMRSFRRVQSSLQGVLVGLMLVGAIMSFFIGPPVETALVSSAAGRMLPPVWFLGLYQKLIGTQDPVFIQLAGAAVKGLAAVIAVSVVAYALRYKRHQAMTMELTPTPPLERRWLKLLFERSLPEPRQAGIFVFMARTLAQSGLHRALITGYLGLALAVSIAGVIGSREIGRPHLLLNCIVYVHLVWVVCAVLGMKHAFSIPAEWRANWVFQITELDGREHWRRAVELFSLVPVLFLLVITPVPLLVGLLGWRGLAETVLVGLAALLLHAVAFRQWEKLPFTCTYAPGKTPPLFIFAKFAVVLAVSPVITAVAVTALLEPAIYLAECLLLVGGYLIVRKSRNAFIEVNSRLRYEDGIEPVVSGLELG